MTQWDTISASLISDEKPFTYGCFGVVLKVPSQNILITHNSDMMFRNNVGDIKRQHFDHMKKNTNLADLPCFARNGLLSKEIINFNRKYGIISPEEILRDTYCEHNELVIATRPGINIHPGLPATRQVEITAVFKKSLKKAPPYYWQEVMDKIASSSARYNCPVLDIPGTADVEDW